MQVSKYARVERERRFLLAQFPRYVKIERIRRIVDRYIDGTTLRLRELCEEGGSAIYKLTQKLPQRAAGARQGLITTVYVTASEFGVFAQLPAKILHKTRYSVPPFGIDVFAGELDGLVLAEAEFDSAAEAEALTLPDFIGPEVSAEERFTGGRLACASQADIAAWLSEYGVSHLRTAG